jgi:hypothetical protein
MSLFSMFYIVFFTYGLYNRVNVQSTIITFTMAMKHMAETGMSFRKEEYIYSPLR